MQVVQLLTGFTAEFMAILPIHQLATADIVLRLLAGQPERQRK